MAISKKQQRIYNKRYREKNREKLRLAASEYHAANRERNNKRSRERYLANKGGRLAYAKRSYLLNRDELVAGMRSRRMLLREAMLRILGAKCKCCGEDWVEFLNLDHIHGGGNKHFAERGTWGVMNDVLDDPNRAAKYQVLCSNCNMAKSRYGVCPHQAPQLRKKRGLEA